MEKTRWTHVAAPLVLVLSFSGCATSPQTAAEPEVVDLSGDWVLNEQLSDSPSDVLKKASDGNNIGGLVQTFGGLIRVYGISAADVAGMLPAGAEEEAPEFHSHVTDPRAVLNVLQSSDSLEVKYDRAGTEVYQYGQTIRDEKEKIFSDWEEDTYVVRREPDDSLPITEIFELADDGELLIWTIQFETGNGKDLEITRVYEAVLNTADEEQSS